MNVISSCACCKACQPRYKRLVDSIYPTNPELGLVKANMQKLTFYAISHPEKLDRIGDYLANRLSRDIYRLRIGFVQISVEAMDSLLAACHGSPSLNLFVESFLKVIQKLLETHQPDFEIMATESFIGFANIQEDTPSYHRRYDFFISKFSSLCHSNHPAGNIRTKLRGAGIKGLRGVVRKTVSDDLQANIWEKQHMEKIVPSLLFNMHDGVDLTDSSKQILFTSGGSTDENVEETPLALADSCLRELIGKASFGSMKCVLQPVLNHFDYHKLWSYYPPLFAMSCFEIIMYSIQAQYSYVVIQLVINHLDCHSEDEAGIRLGIATVLSRIVLIAATASIGPTLLEIFNSMLRHLRQSVDLQFNSSDSLSDDTEKQYQETLINTMGDFANNLPDYQKVEIMMFIIGKVPSHTSCRQAETFLQKVLVRTLLKVATKYRTGHLATVLTPAFLEPLLRLALNDDASVRLLVQEILHTLFDRHGNAASLSKRIVGAGTVDDLNLVIEKCPRVDAMFMRKNGYLMYSTLYKCALASGNRLENFEALLTTLLLFFVEVGCEEVIVDSYRLILGLQSAALDESLSLNAMSRACLHNLVAKYINLTAQLLAIPSLCQHAQQVLKARTLPDLDPRLNLLKYCDESVVADPLSAISADAASESAAMQDSAGGTGANKKSKFAPPTPPDDPSPPSSDGRFHQPYPIVLPDEALFDKGVLIEALQSRNFDVTPFGMPFVPRPTSLNLSQADSAAGGGNSAVDAGSASLDIASIDSLSLDDATRRNSRRNTVLGVRLHNGAPAPVTVSMLRQLVNQPIEYWEKLEEERCKEITLMFRTLPYEQLVAKQRENCRDMGDTLKKFLDSCQEKHASRLGAVAGGSEHKLKDISSIEFPDLFVY